MKLILKLILGMMALFMLLWLVLGIWSCYGMSKYSKKTSKRIENGDILYLETEFNFYYDEDITVKEIYTYEYRAYILTQFNVGNIEELRDILLKNFIAEDDEFYDEFSDLDYINQKLLSLQGGDKYIDFSKAKNIFFYSLRNNFVFLSSKIRSELFYYDGSYYVINSEPIVSLDNEEQFMTILER